jgi:hypothetical protein
MNRTDDKLFESALTVSKTSNGPIRLSPQDHTIRTDIVTPM